jgi:hypothetical protein
MMFIQLFWGDLGELSYFLLDLSGAVRQTGIFLLFFEVLFFFLSTNHNKMKGLAPIYFMF